MAGYSTITDLCNATIDGRATLSSFRKSPTQTTTAGLWFDLSMSPGNPVPNYYAAAPGASVRLAQSTDGGLYHGAAVSPMFKYLRETTLIATAATALPMPVFLMDYLIYYPFIDEGTTDEQPLVTTNGLTRYTNGAGVQVMAVSVAARTGGQSFFINYTNSDGVSGRISQTVVQNAATANGTIVTSATATNGAAGPFIPLANGDTGVRSIESVTMLGADVGLFTLVLVQPIAQTCILGIDAPVESDYFLHRSTSPRIVDDAYLNFICMPNGSLAATSIHGIIKTNWN